MDIKSHPDYWKIHKEIYQQEYDNLNSGIREVVTSTPHSRVAKDFNTWVTREVERKLLFPVE